MQGVPKYGAGLYLYDMPWGSDGLLGMAGVLGLCVALVAAVTYALDLFRPATAACRPEPAAGLRKSSYGQATHEDDKTGKPGMAQDAPESTRNNRATKPGAS